jgi:hypothetical protein
MRDELEVLKDWDADAAPLSESARARARHQLLNTMVRAEHGSGAGASLLGRRRALRFATATVATMAVAGTVVLVASDGNDGGAPSNPRMANVSAATVLNGAAARASRNENTIDKTVPPRDDQFIYSKRIIKETDQKTGKVASYVDTNWDSVDGSKRSLTMEKGSVIWEEANGKDEGIWPARDWRGQKKIPTDPEKLAPYIVSMGTSKKPISDFNADERASAYFEIGEILKAPVLPPGLRSAAYKSLGLIPGVKAIEGVKDSAGRTGVGIKYTGPRSQKGKYLIFAKGTYEFLGFRDVRTSGDKEYVQLSHMVEWAIVDRLRQKP